MSNGQIVSLLAVIALVVVLAVIRSNRKGRADSEPAPALDMRNTYGIAVSRHFDVNGEVAYFYQAQYHTANEYKWTHIDTCISREVAEKVCRNHAELSAFDTFIFIGRLP